MPELPEVEAVCRLVGPRIRGCVIRFVEVYRPRTVAPIGARAFSQRLQGSKMIRLQRRGKNLVIHLKPGRRMPDCAALLIHLRMSGDLYVDSTNRPIPPAACVVFHLSGGRRLILEDKRGLAVCSLLTADEAAARLGKVGVEPLSPRFTAHALFEMMRHSSLPIKIFLMDQRRVAGLGNIYVAEALFRAGIDPRARAASLSAQSARQLHQAIVGVLRGAVKSALQGYRHPTGGFSRQEEFEPQVYGREGQPCRKCGSVIRRIRQGNRSTYYCPKCQMVNGT